MKIREIRTTPLALPFKEPYHWAGRLDLGATLVLIEVETDTGIVGIGESVGTRPAHATAEMIRAASRFFLGESPFDIEGLFARAYLATGNVYMPRLANMVFAGLEMALWDVIGKATGRPVYQLMGGARQPEVDYFAFLQGDTAEELVEDARAAVAAGYSVIYMKVGRGEDLDLANVAAVRDVIGDRHLRLDGNEAWDPGTAIYMINRLARFAPEFIEQPTPSHSLAALGQVKASVSVPIAADQSVYTLADVYEVCRRQAADVIVLGSHETGGMLNLKKAAAIAEAAGIRICLHGQFVTGITDCAQHQVAMTLPNLTAGNQIMHQLLQEDLITSPDLTPRQGKLPAIDRPGLGCELNWETIRRAAALYEEDDEYRSF
jgi:muconate cycloisomerase